MTDSNGTLILEIITPPVSSYKIAFISPACGKYAKKKTIPIWIGLYRNTGRRKKKRKTCWHCIYRLWVNTCHRTALPTVLQAPCYFLTSLPSGRFIKMRPCLAPGQLTPLSSLYAQAFGWKSKRNDDSITFFSASSQTFFFLPQRCF